MTCNGMPHWQELPFEPTYHALTDVPLYKWLNRSAGPHWKHTQRFAFHRNGEDEHELFHTVPMEPDNIQVHSYGMAAMNDEWELMRTARTTPLTIAQIAWWMGYREFYYLGIEQSRGYAWAPDQLTSNNNRSEFPADKNPRYSYAIMRCGRRMREDIESKGGTIYDCTPKGLLNPTGKEVTRRGISWQETFEYRDLAEVLG